MANENFEDCHSTVGAWAKRCYFSGRAAMEDMLRPFDLGSTQWYILDQLCHDGPTIQRDLGRLLRVERSTMTVTVAVLVRKGWIEQVVDPRDQRRKLLRVTAAGRALWKSLPDLSIIGDIAFAGISDPDKNAAIQVLRVATERLDDFIAKGCTA